MIRELNYSYPTPPLASHSPASCAIPLPRLKAGASLMKDKNINAVSTVEKGPKIGFGFARSLRLAAGRARMKRILLTLSILLLGCLVSPIRTFYSGHTASLYAMHLIPQHFKHDQSILLPSPAVTRSTPHARQLAGCDWLSDGFSSIPR